MSLLLSIIRLNKNYKSRNIRNNIFINFFPTLSDKLLNIYLTCNLIYLILTSSILQLIKQIFNILEEVSNINQPTNRNQ